MSGGRGRLPVPFLETYMETLSNALIRELPTDALESYIELRYESEASQAELDVLETIFAERVTEENPAMTEDDPQMSEEQFNVASLEDGLFDLYRRYLQPQGRRDGLLDDADIVSGLRSWVEEAGFCLGGLRRGVTDEQLLDAAKDVYERKRNLIRKHAAQRSHVAVLYRSRASRGFIY